MKIISRVAETREALEKAKGKSASLLTERTES